MNQVTPGCLVCGYEARIPRLSLPDKDDRHVLAAALEAQAGLRVTYNMADFPNAVLRRYGVQAAHPDVFLCALFDEKSELFLRGLRAHRASLQRPSKTPDEYIATLRANGLRWLAARVEPHLTAI